MSLIESCQLFGTDFLPLQNRFIYDNDRISAVGHDGSNIHNEDKEDENISDDDADMPYLPSMDELMNSFTSRSSTTTPVSFIHDDIVSHQQQTHSTRKKVQYLEAVVIDIRPISKKKKKDTKKKKI